MLGELHYRSVLVAVDRSDGAKLALSAAITLARRDNAALTLIHVVPDVADVGRWPGVPIALMPSQGEVDREGERLMRETVEQVPGDIPVTTIVARGKPGPEIVRAALERDYDAVLLGARGVGRVGSLVGSVSQHVLHHADKPVFVAHAPRAVEAA
jgi:nucleotide-binding universal stress UspA family protein